MAKTAAENNKGAVSVFAALMTMLIFDIFVISVLYAQYAAAKGMACDAVTLADNGVRATYNKAIKEAYGITCYTTSERDMTNIAEYFMNDAMSINAAVHGKVVYEGKPLSDTGEFKSQVTTYMKRWDKVAGCLNESELLACSTMALNIPNLVNWLEGDLESAAGKEYGLGDVDISPDSGTDHQEKLQKFANAGKARANALGRVNFENSTPWMSEKNIFSYAGSSDKLSPVKVVINGDKAPEENVRMAVKVLKKVENYMKNMNAVYMSMLDRTDKYELALYAVNNFSAFHYYGSTALTGNYYGSGDFTSVSPWGENEFLVNAAGSDEANVKAVSNMIYNIYFTEYLYKLYYSEINSPKIGDYAEILANGDADMKKLYRDEFMVGLSAQLAFKALDNMYNWKPVADATFSTYPQFIQLFDMIEVQRDESGFIRKMQYLMDANAAQSTGAEAQEFSCADAYTNPEIRKCYVETAGLMVGGGLRVYVRR